MTEEAKKIVEALRICHSNEDCRDCKFIDSDKDEMSCVNVLFVKAADLIESLSAQLEQVTRERDALLDELKGECDVCANRKDCTAPKCRNSQHKECEDCSCRTCIIDTNWKWEGVEMEG